MVSQVFPSPYSIDNDSDAVVDAYGMTAFDPPSTEYDYLTSILEFVSNISKTMDTASITVAAVPVAIYKSSYHLPTASITVSAVPLTSLGIGTILSTATISTTAEAIELSRGPVTLTTPTITIEALPVTAAVAALAIDLVTAEITVETDAVRTSIPLSTAGITVTAYPVGDSEATHLTTAAITVTANPVSAVVMTTLELTDLELPIPEISITEAIEAVVGSHYSSITRVVFHVSAAYRVYKGS